MKKQKNRFFSLLCALMPGAGPMYLGLMKRGASQMLLFCLDILVSIIIPPFLVFLPVIWFYGFFDTLNLRNMTVEQIDELIEKDNYLFTDIIAKSGSVQLGRIFDRFHLLIGWIFVGFGLYSIYQRIDNYIWNLIYSYEIEYLFWISRAMDLIPTAVVSFLLIWLGIRFIRGKKIRLGSEDEYVPYGGGSDTDSEEE